MEERYEENGVKWLIDKPGGLFLTRRSGTLRRAGENGYTSLLSEITPEGNITYQILDINGNPIKIFNP